MIEDQGTLSPSSFIPFCSFGGNASVEGKSNNNFNSPVCDKFSPTFLDGQLCYQVDPNELRNKVDMKKMASHGIIMLLDYNFERMVRADGNEDSRLEDSSILLENKDNRKEAMIYIETLGKKLLFF